MGTHIDGQCIRFSTKIKNVGVQLDQHLTMERQINQTVSLCYKQLRDIGSIRNVLTKRHTEMLIHAVVSSRLDYCNSLYSNIGSENLYKLQKVQNAAARLVSKKRKQDSARALLNDLHWLNIRCRIAYKILLIVFKAIRDECPVNIKYKTHVCRPHEQLMLEQSFAQTKYGRRLFSFVAPRLWNALPVNIRLSENIEQFKKSIKTFLFNNDSFTDQAK